MRSLLILMLSVLAALVMPMPMVAPVDAQNPLSTPACGLGRYWLVQDNAWDTVWSRRGDSNTFDGQSAFWMQPEVSTTMNISLSGNSVSVDGVDDPNSFGMLTCSYQGTVRDDGVSVVGNAICQQEAGTSRALSWSAVIVCDTPVITWTDTAFWYRAAKGHQFSFECPAGGSAAPIWGTGNYIEGSSICAAGVHAGVITPDNGGMVTIEILPGDALYTGSAQNGVTSESFTSAGQFNASFRVVGGQTGQQQQPTVVPTTDPVVLGTGSVIGVWDTSFGVITIAEDGVGTYDDYGDVSHVYFQHDDSQTISGYWVEKSSARDCGVERNGSRFWGRLKWTFDEQFNSFDGLYGYCDDEPDHSWSGSRVS